MSRSNLEDSRAHRIFLGSAKVGFVEKSLTEDYEVEANSPLFYFLDPNGAERSVTLPPIGDGGAMFGFANCGSSESLLIKNQAGTTLLTLTTDQSGIFVASRTQWKFFSYSISSGTENTTMSSADSSISISHVGDNFDVTVNEANVDHDSLSGFVANEHIDHTSITLTAGTGLSGGGDISANRTFALDIDGLTEDAIAAADTIPFHDSGDGPNKITFANFEAALDHDSLSGFAADEHIDHSTVSVTAGTGLTGGGTIESTRTLSLDVTANIDWTGNHSFDATITFEPGSDADITLLTVNVTGSPTLLWDEDADAFQIQPGLIVGDPGAEASGITVNGTTYESALKTSSIGSSDVAEMILHRHSTTSPAIFVGSRSNSDDNTHLAVADNDPIFHIYGAAIDADGEDYNLAGLISFAVDGTPGTGDLPGEIQFHTNAGSQTLTQQMVVRADGSIECTSANFTINGGDQVLTQDLEVIIWTISAPDTDIETGTGVDQFEMPFAMTLTDIIATMTTAPTGQSAIFDVNEGGTSIMTTNKLEIEAGETSTEDATTQPTLTDTSLAAGAAITADIDQVGSTVAGQEVKIYLIGYRT